MKIYLFFLIFLLFFGNAFLLTKYYSFSSYKNDLNDSYIKMFDEMSKENDEIFWYFIIGIFIFYITFLLSKQLSNMTKHFFKQKI